MRTAVGRHKLTAMYFNSLLRLGCIKERRMIKNRKKNKKKKKLRGGNEDLASDD